ncbi:MULTISPECIES: AP2 domain-containing protein [unclassified Bradyrhizobium]|uniref:AP2 domain-containing protein n=1 Tax=unclassified Bradyrhizobium TaxID=2631580 RepID=UPI0028A05279|nr:MULTISPECIES: AP2 domain-containing protein [unclassified Bradyrhizobium]
MKKRPITIEGDIARVPLTKGYVAIIDAADVDLVDGYNWHASTHPNGTTVYACRKERDGAGKWRVIRLHRAILGVTDPEIEVDHKDLAGLNCRRANLRECSHAKNQRNRRMHRNNASGLKGASWDARRRKWRAHIEVSGLKKHLGYFDTPEAAHAAYCAAATDVHGEFARAA